jgi:hypothetical protein
MSSKSIYTYNKVIEFLKSVNADTTHPSKFGWYFKNLLPDTYTEICEKTSFLKTPTFTERLFCYTNDITEYPTCKVCDNHTTYSIVHKTYHRYCSQRCSMLDMKSLIGVDNASQLQSVKDKKRQVFQEKYGESAYMKTEEGKKRASNTQKTRWNERFQNMVENIADAEFNYTYKEYHRIVHTISNWFYRNNQDSIDPQKLRGRSWHLDHKVSICYGYQNKISPAIIGDITNIQMLSMEINVSKSYKNSMTIEELINEYNEYYSKNEKPPLDENFKPPKVNYIAATFTEITGICKYCTGPANYVKKSGEMQCAPSHLSCPAVIQKRVGSYINNGSNKTNTAAGKKWFNDGNIDVLRYDCPPGFKHGRQPNK